MKGFKLLLLAASCVLPLAAQAHFTTVHGLEFRPIRTDAPTHLIVVGYADDAGNEFLKAGITRMERLRSAFPDDQIILYRSNEDDFDDARDSLRSFGLRIVDSSEDDLSAGNFLRMASRFSKIRSIAFFAHSGLFNGIRLGDDEQRISTETGNIEILRGKFTPDANVQVFGCNGAFSISPFLSKKWGVAVTGALTGGPFEGLYSDGKWYVNDDDTAPGVAWSSRNGVSFDTSVSCAKGVCIRIKPQNSTYDSTWGKFSAGLGFFKFFCDGYDSDPDACNRAMANSLLGFPSTKNLKPSSPRADWIEVLNDWICPNSPNASIRRTCVQGLENAIATGNEILNVFYGPPIECSMSGCQVSFRDHPGGIFSRDTYRMIAPRVTEPRTVVQEYKRFLRGIDLITGTAR